eukprot:gene6092-4383_t
MTPPVLKLVVLGDSGAGKTSIIRRYTEDTFDSSYKPTIGADFRQKKIVVGDTAAAVQLWDTAGQERFVALGASYFRGADACVLVFDTTLRASFDNASRWFEEYYLHTGNRTCVVLGNKCDLAAARQVDRRAAEDWCTHQNRNGDPECPPAQAQIRYFETTAISGTTVRDAIDALVGCLLAQRCGVVSAPVHSSLVFPQTPTPLPGLAQPPAAAPPPPPRNDRRPVIPGRTPPSETASEPLMQWTMMIDDTWLVEHIVALLLKPISRNISCNRTGGDTPMDSLNGHEFWR